MTLIVESDQSLIELYQTTLGGGATVVPSLDEADAHLSGNPREYAVVLGPSVTAQAAFSIAEKLRVSRPSLSLILVRPRIDSALLADALRYGVREVVESRDLNSLGVAARRAYNLWEAIDSQNSGTADSPPARVGQLYTSFSTKGGVGKSTVATNVAAAFAAAGRATCLVDLDVQDGDLAIMLQVLPNRSLGDLADIIGAVDKASVESLLIQHSENLSLIAAPPRMNAVDRLAPESVGRVLELLKSMFEIVVVDTSGAYDDYALHALDHSDVVLLVGTLDIPALKSLKVATETLELLNIPRTRWRLVLNRADARVGLSASEFEKTLGLDVSASMPSSREVLAAVNSGQVMVRSNPRHPVSQSIRSLVSELGAGSGKAPAAPQHATEPGARKLLRRKVHRS